MVSKDYGLFSSTMDEVALIFNSVDNCYKFLVVCSVVALSLIYFTTIEGDGV